MNFASFWGLEELRLIQGQWKISELGELLGGGGGVAKNGVCWEREECEDAEPGSGNEG